MANPPAQQRLSRVSPPDHGEQGLEARGGGLATTLPHQVRAQDVAGVLSRISAPGVEALPGYFLT
jgi:hypothetical protein